MILKCLSRKSGTRQILNYLFKDKGKLRGEKSQPLVIRHNVRSRTLDNWVKEFEANEAMRIHRRKNSVEIYHTVLSFSNKDKDLITEKMLRDVSKWYMKERGENNLYIGTAHYDHDHVHLHLIMSGTKYLTGQANRQSKAEFKKLKLAMDEYQRKKYPELVNSLPRHGRSQELKQSPKERSQHIRQSQKETLLRSLNTAYSNAKSLDSFLTELRSTGHEPYYRAGRLTGVKFEGDRKFRFQTLGYDKDKISKLEAEAEKEAQELDELAEIRDTASSREREDDGRNREIEEEEDDADDETDDNDSDDDDDDTK